MYSINTRKNIAFFLDGQFCPSATPSWGREILMNPEQINFIVNGIRGAAGADVSADRDVRCVIAILTDPVISYGWSYPDAVVLIEDLINICYDGNVNRIIAAIDHAPSPFLESTPEAKGMVDWIFQVVKNKLSSAGEVDFDSLRSACYIYGHIVPTQVGSVRSVIRRITKELGANKRMDSFLEEEFLAFPDIRNIIASALIEEEGAISIWMRIKPAFREGYKGLDEWLLAVQIKASIQCLVQVSSTKEIIEKVKRMVEELNCTYCDPYGGERWFKEDKNRLTWWNANIAQSK